MEETFIPDYLAMALDKVIINNGTNKKIVLENKTLITFPESAGPNKFVAFLLSPIFFFLILLIVEVNFLMMSLKNQQNKWIVRFDQLWLWVVNICSLFMVFMWVGTDHIPTKDNWNLLWASPLIPVWWWMQKKGSSSVKYLSYFLLLGIVVSIVNAIPGVQSAPPPLLTTTSDSFISWCLATIDWIIRAIWSAPPPVPAGTMNSTSLVGSQAAAEVTIAAIATAATQLYFHAPDAAFIVSPSSEWLELSKTEPRTLDSLAGLVN